MTTTNPTAATAAPLVILDDNNQAITTSIAIAEHFGYRHKNVLRAIRELECSAEFNRLNIRPMSYRDQYGREQRGFNITRDGFMFLAMGFTGHKAAQWKERYITAFNELADKQLKPIAPSAELQYQAAVDVVPALVRQALLKAKPVWAKIHRYKMMGLQNTEIATLMGWTRSTVSTNLRKMELLGLIEPPKNLAQMQKKMRNINNNLPKAPVAIVGGKS